jgi:hypothetical protein
MGITSVGKGSDFVFWNPVGFDYAFVALLLHLNF